MRARRLALAVVVVAAMSSRAHGEIVHLKTPSTVKTDGGSTVRLPAGYFLDEETWARKDAEKKQAEEDRTRFRAENESLRKHAQDVSWKTVAVTFLGGMAVGAVVLQMAK